MTLWITVVVSTTTAAWQLPESTTMITTMRPTWAQVTLCCGPCFTGRKGRVRMETSITHWGMCKRNQRCNCRHAHTLTHSHSLTLSHSHTHTLTPTLSRVNWLSCSASNHGAFRAAHCRSCCNSLPCRRSSPHARATSSRSPLCSTRGDRSCTWLRRPARGLPCFASAQRTCLCTRASTCRSRRAT